MLILQQLINGLMLGGLYVMVAVAFTLIIGMLNFLNFTIPALFMVAAMMMWATMTGNLPFGNETLNGVFGEANLWIPGIFVSILVISIASLVIERFTYRYMKAKYGDATEHALPLVSSLGFLIMFEHLVISAYGSDPLTVQSPFGDAAFTIGPLLFSYPQVISLVLSLGIVFTLHYIIRRTKLGRALRAIAERPDTATLMGVDVLRIVPVVYVITGLLCAISGILFTINYRRQRRDHCHCRHGAGRSRQCMGRRHRGPSGRRSGSVFDLYRRRRLREGADMGPVADHSDLQADRPVRSLRNRQGEILR